MTHASAASFLHSRPIETAALSVVYSCPEDISGESQHCEQQFSISRFFDCNSLCVHEAARPHRLEGVSVASLQSLSPDFEVSDPPFLVSWPQDPLNRCHIQTLGCPDLPIPLQVPVELRAETVRGALGTRCRWQPFRKAEEVEVHPKTHHRHSKHSLCS